MGLLPSGGYNSIIVKCLTRFVCLFYIYFCDVIHLKFKYAVLGTQEIWADKFELVRQTYTQKHAHMHAHGRFSLFTLTVLYFCFDIVSESLYFCQRTFHHNFLHLSQITTISESCDTSH